MNLRFLFFCKFKNMRPHTSLASHYLSLVQYSTFCVYLCFPLFKMRKSLSGYSILDFHSYEQNYAFFKICIETLFTAKLKNRFRMLALQRPSTKYLTKMFQSFGTVHESCTFINTFKQQNAHCFYASLKCKI